MKSNSSNSVSLTTSEAISRAKRLLKKGKDKEAGELYRSVLEADPNNKIARKALKKLKVIDDPKSYLNQLYLLYQDGKLDQVVATGKTLLDEFGQDPELHNAIGVAFKELGDTPSAIEFLKQAVALDPDIPEFHNNLGGALIEARRYIEAHGALQEAVRLRSNYAEALCNLGLALCYLEKFCEAEEVLLEAHQLNPDSAIILFNLGRNAQAAENYVNASDYYSQSVAIKPNFPEAHSNLALCFTQLRLYTEAIASHQRVLELRPGNMPDTCNLVTALIGAGKSDEALVYIQKVLERAPNDPLALRTMGNVLEARKDFSHAVLWYEKAISMDPRDPSTYNNLAAVQMRVKQLSLAKKNLLKALSLDPNHFPALANLGHTLNELFEHSASLEYFDRALALSPDSSAEYSNLLFGLNYNPDLSSEEIFSYYKKYDEHFCIPYREQWPKLFFNKNSKGKIKIGYLSPDFKKHSVTLYLLPILENHDRNKFSIYAYSQLAVEDSMTEQIQNTSDFYINTVGLSDEELARKIMTDGIDLLIDLAGHTDGNRLPMLARYKPAPTIVTFLGFGYTTGLSAVDYYLTDWVAAPSSSENFFSETPWRLSNVPLLYRPMSDTGAPQELPAIRNGYITFGTLTRSIRINAFCVSIWSELLKCVKGSKLILNSQSFSDDTVREKLCILFGENGITNDRLIIGFDSPPWDTYRNIDITLDCFPHNSGTTLIESLYMGVPFVTLCGRPSVGRLGASILTTMNRREWIAEDSQEYISKAVRLAENIDELSLIRASLRSEMETSSIMNEAGFTRELEDAFQGMCGRVTNN